MSRATFTKCWRPSRIRELYLIVERMITGFISPLKNTNLCFLICNYICDIRVLAKNIFENTGNKDCFHPYSEIFNTIYLDRSSILIFKIHHLFVSIFYSQSLSKSLFFSRQQEEQYEDQKYIIVL